METKKSYKSFRYKANVVWKSARRGTLSSLGKPEVLAGSPPEFKGETGVWSPEELLVGSLNTCLMLTFLAFALPQGLEIVAYDSTAEGLLEYAEGKYRITEVAVHPTVVVKSQADVGAAEEIMGKVEANCFITNSITAKVKLTPQFRVGSGA